MSYTSRASRVVRALLATVALSVCMGAASEAHAIVLTFDDVPPTSDIMFDYGGLTWLNMTIEDGVGYQATSGDQVMSNNFNLFPSASAADTNFNFYGVQLSRDPSFGPYTGHSTVSITGYNSGSVVDSLTYHLTGTTPTLVTANFMDIDSLVFSTAGYDGFALDDFSFDFVSSPASAVGVPELDAGGLIAALLLLGLAFAVLSGNRQRALAA